MAKSGESVKNLEQGLSLLRLTSGDASEAAVVSPVSVSTALAMAMLGVDGQTLKQVQKTMYNGESEKSIFDKYCVNSTLSRDFKQQTEMGDTASVQMVFAQAGIVFLPKYMEDLRVYFDDTIHYIEFEGGANGATNAINVQIAEATNDMIKNALCPGHLSEAVRLMLVDAVAYKCLMHSKYDSKEEGVFHKNASSQIEVSMMVVRDVLSYAQDDEMEMVGMPMKGLDKNLYCFLPRKRFGLDDLEKKIKGESLLNLMNNEYYADIRVRMPLMKMNSCHDLKQPLSVLGIADLFMKKKANLSKMSMEKDLCLNTLIQNISFQLCEGNASTDINEYREPMTEVKFDHGFLFIVCGEDRLVHMIGRFI